MNRRETIQKTMGYDYMLMVSIDDESYKSDIPDKIVAAYKKLHATDNFPTFAEKEHTRTGYWHDSTIDGRQESSDIDVFCKKLTELTSQFPTCEFLFYYMTFDGEGLDIIHIKDAEITKLAEFDTEKGNILNKKCSLFFQLNSFFEIAPRCKGFKCINDLLDH